MKSNIKRISFKGEELYIGMDVHNKNWMISIVSKNLFLKRYSQEPDPSQLSKYLKKHYPEAAYKCVYEAGYSGFWIAEALQKEGIDCIIVNPADIPTTNKQKDQKTDKIDSKKLAELLRTGLLHGIYIPKAEELEDRSLLRSRSLLIRSQSATKNRIKAYLAFYGISVTDEQLSRYWAKNYIEYLKSIKFIRSSGQAAFAVLLRQLDYLREEILHVTRKIRELAATEKYKDKIERLRSIPGIGIINALTILTEVSDVSRFSSANKFRGYIGLIPKEHTSGENTNRSEMSRRGNNRLKTMLIESAWVAIRTDPAMTLAFEELVKRLKKSKAIIRIARKLANRILHILVTDEEYVFSVA